MRKEIGVNLMCHAVRVKLTAEDRATARRLTGLLLPAYAMVALALVALAVLTAGPRSGDLVATNTAPIAAR
jgi:hypothetical protein